ncbi:MAG: DPP IV N-terminal domain-containing protein [Armatimonadetes bacterium]|nr:DPP IV N-terminal domain-containing protein [Armatimonadota bacterium]MDE2206798.1 DPP IV N-terminal domain-containing protein [Armatimonadota bacterium]
MSRPSVSPIGIAALSLFALAGAGPGHQRFRMPTAGLPPAMVQYFAHSAGIFGGLAQGRVNSTWEEGGKVLQYDADGQTVRLDVTTMQPAAPAPAQPAAGGPPQRGARRGRQVTETASPDGVWKATYRAGNVYIAKADGTGERPVTTDGSPERRVLYGTACWVYGEELEQTSAMWWSPDSSMLAYYKFDERKQLDYYTVRDQLRRQDSLNVEPYPLPGAPNPEPTLYVFSLATGKSVKLDVRSGQPFTDAVMGHYVYSITWRANSKELLFLRTNRLQNHLQLMAASPATGTCRVVVDEQWPKSWVENWPQMVMLRDGHHFLWVSSRSGFSNIYEYDLDAPGFTQVTHNGFDLDKILLADEAHGVIWYTAFDGAIPLNRQLHRVEFNGTGDRRVTDAMLNHHVTVAPDGEHFVDQAESITAAPFTELCSAAGAPLKRLGSAQTAAMKSAGVLPAKLFSFIGPTGSTTLYGTLEFPPGFNPARKYPLLVSVYGGPLPSNWGRSGPRSVYTAPTPMTALGYIVATIETHSENWRGKAFSDAIYQHMGVTEIDDQAAGVRYLDTLPYIDATRVGIFGTSYGGYASVMCILRYPNLFQAASASSPPTDWHLYDSTYTERYMGIPPAANSAYDAGSAMTYAGNLKGHLQIYFGTADNNVHPANSLRLIAKLRSLNKPFEMMLGPDEGHSFIGMPAMVSFFDRWLKPTG